MASEKHNRFISNTLSNLQEVNQNPIFDYDDLPVLTLEEAVEKVIQIVPDVVDYVLQAKENCNQNSTLLTLDESTAIYLYSMPVMFYSHLNIALRAANRHALKPWFAFLKLFITALEKLPSTKAIIWRGVNYDATLNFVDNDIHTLWNINSCSMDPNIVQQFLGESGTLFVVNAIHGKDISTFSAIPDEKEVILMPGTRVRRKYESLNFIDRLFVLHLEEINPQRGSQSESNYLFEQIKQEYQRNCRIERFMNRSKSFPIEQSYINLAIVTAKEQLEKEKKLGKVQQNHAIIGTFEEIYGMKTAIDVKDILKTCKNQEKQVLIFGRAGMGKSTFCRYVAYQWAKGFYWPHYELLALIPLRRLTANRYPQNNEYSLIDLVKKEVFQFDLSEKDDILLKKQFDAKKTLWILDGYDEIVQNVPPHLECLLEQLLKTPHHIITSRPYLNTLSYDIQMEITGFTDDNIEKYVQQFFNQMKDELDDALIKSQKLLSFLKSNSSIWGVAHIPVNLELICSLWSNEDWSETEHLTITKLYTIITEWLCRRYLTPSNKHTPNLSKYMVEQRCEQEMAFLENLAFRAMENNTIIIRPSLLKKALNEAKLSLQDHSHFLNIGILKSFNKQGIGTQIETDKDHYFVHLSFQEYFAARYLVNALKASPNEKVIKFIKHQKYNQRYALVFTFTAGLLSETDIEPCLNIFWDNILGEPLDLVGARHMQVVISCMEEAIDKSTIPRHAELLEWIAQCLKDTFSPEKKILREHLSQSLQRAQSVTCHETILNAFINLLQCRDSNTSITLLSFISELKISNPSVALMTSVATILDDPNHEVRMQACAALANICEKTVTNEVIRKLVSVLGDEYPYVGMSACELLQHIGQTAATNEVIGILVSALGDMSKDAKKYACEVLRRIDKKATTNEVISQLVSALGDKDKDVRDYALETLKEMDESTATNEVITKLVNALGDMNEDVRRYACEALGSIGTKATTNKVINKLVSALGYDNEYVRMNACNALRRIGKKAATNEVICKLVSALEDEKEDVRQCAYGAIGEMGEKIATNEMITKLMSVLGDKKEYVRQSACKALGEMSEKAATNDVISKLVSALGDKNEYVRQYASEALRKIGKKAATNEVISQLVSALEDMNKDVREYACEALADIGEKAATNEVISKLLNVLRDESKNVRRYAYKALENMGDKAPANEVISKLVSALEDEKEDFRQCACESLGRMGEKAATNEVINKLVCALEDENRDVRKCACEALRKIGQKAVTNEVISKLASAVEDENEDVRQCACKALGEMGEKAATNDVISKLASAVEDEKEAVREFACKALVKMGENAATNDVISKLVIALADKNTFVRRYADEALKNIGEKAATNEVISKLVSALEDEKEDVRQCACKALGEMGENAATNDVINKLVSALGDKNQYVRQYACEALRKIGEKAVTNEVIDKLVSALGDMNKEVRQHACEALRNLGEKATTNKVIRELVSALHDEEEDVRQCAFKTIGQMGEKAATNEVIRKLVWVLRDPKESVRMHACEVLGKMGEKAATNEVMSQLAIALGYDKERVRQSACVALGKISEKAITNEVISKVLCALEDENRDVSRCACEALGKMGEKAATNEVISKLTSIMNTRENRDSEVAGHAVSVILSSSAVITQLDPNVVADLCWCKYAFDCLKNISEDRLIKFFFNAQNPNWLSAVTKIILVKIGGLTATDNKLVVYGSQEPLEIPVPNPEVCRQLIEAFTDQRKRWHLYFEIA